MIPIKKTNVFDFLITHELQELHKEQLVTLYSKEWWCNLRTRDDVDTLLQGCSLVIGVIESTSNQLIGFARIITDFYKYAYIHDVIVDEEYRGLGFGKLIVESIIHHPKLKHLKNLELTCREENMPFYEKFGFSRNFGLSIPMRRSNPDVTVR